MTTTSPGEFSSEGLRSAAIEIRGLAVQASPWPCPEWTYAAVRHIARNCDVECNHSQWDDEAGEWLDLDCPSPTGTWDRYDSSPHIHAWSPNLALEVSTLLDTLADWMDEGYDDNWPPFAAARSVVQAWTGGKP